MHDARSEGQTLMIGRVEYLAHSTSLLRLCICLHLLKQG